MTEIIPIKRRCSTTYMPDVIDEEFANELFIQLRDSIEWEEGIRSRKGPTRKAKSFTCFELLTQYPIVIDLINSILEYIPTRYVLNSIYINYYETGDNWTPNHSHRRTHQLVISLGGERILTVGKKEYLMKNGDVILFGSSVHGVPKTENAEPRISIATFMSPVKIN